MEGKALWWWRRGENDRYYMVLRVSLNSACRQPCCYWLLVWWPETTTAFGRTLSNQAALLRGSTACSTDRPRKGGLNKACLTLTWSASRGQQHLFQVVRKQWKKEEDSKPQSSMLEHSHYAELRRLSSMTLTICGQGTNSAGHQYCCSQQSTLCRTRLPHEGWRKLYLLLVWEEQGQVLPLWCQLQDQNFHCQKIAELANRSFWPPRVPNIPNPGQQVCHCHQCVCTYSAGWNWTKGGLLLWPAIASKDIISS